jgi:hypothetical protein
MSNMLLLGPLPRLELGVMSLALQKADGEESSFPR